MTYIITSLCLRDGACVYVCPKECIVGGKPTDENPWFYIDPDSCIDCDACVRECPYEAIFPEAEVPSALVITKDRTRQSMPAGTSGFNEAYVGKDNNNQEVKLTATRTLQKGDVVDLTPDVQPNYDFYETGPGYDALD